MRHTQTLTIELTVEMAEGVDSVDVWRDLRKVLSNVQEQAPYRTLNGPGWWANCGDAAQLTSVTEPRQVGLLAQSDAMADRDAFVEARAEWYYRTQGTDRALSATLAGVDWRDGITDPTYDHIAATFRKDTP